MAINWFEGGRRISALLIAVPIIGGLTHVATAGNPYVTIATDGPGEPWYVQTKPCEYPAYTSYPGSRDFGGGISREIELCFHANREGEVPYAKAPAPANAPPPLVRTNPSEPPAAEQKWYFFGERYSSEVTQYTSARRRDFELTPELQDEAKQTLNLSWLAGRTKAFREALPWVGGTIFAIWVTTLIVGWIVRGFAGIPTGKDFRDDAQA